MRREALYWGNTKYPNSAWKTQPQVGFCRCKCHSSEPNKGTTNQLWIFLEHLQLCSLIYTAVRDYARRTTGKWLLKVNLPGSGHGLGLVFCYWGELVFVYKIRGDMEQTFEHCTWSLGVLPVINYSISPNHVASIKKDGHLLVLNGSHTVPSNNRKT